MSCIPRLGFHLAANKRAQQQLIVIFEFVRVFVFCSSCRMLRENKGYLMLGVCFGAE